MRPQMETPTKIPEVAGLEIRTIPRNTARLTQVTPQLPKVGADRKRAAGLSPSAAPAVEVGTPARQAPADRQAEAGGVGAAADEPDSKA